MSRIKEMSESGYRSWEESSSGSEEFMDVKGDIDDIVHSGNVMSKPVARKTTEKRGAGEENPIEIHSSDFWTAHYLPTNQAGTGVLEIPISDDDEEAFVDLGASEIVVGPCIHINSSEFTSDEEAWTKTELSKIIKYRDDFESADAAGIIFNDFKEFTRY